MLLKEHEKKLSSDSANPLPSQDQQLSGSLSTSIGILGYQTAKPAVAHNRDS